MVVLHSSYGVFGEKETEENLRVLKLLFSP